MSALHRLLVLVAFSCAIVCFSSAQAGTLVASTHPLYLIAKAVTAGIEQPVLLLPPASSGHDINLRPSDRLLLKQSDFVIWFGRDYEAPLYDLLENQRNAIALFDLKAFHRLPLRDVKGRAIPQSLDPHIWLDPYNAIGIAYAIATVRAKQFPRYASQYMQNAKNFSVRLQHVVRAEQSQKPRTYWAYHDAYHYLEKSLNLQFAGALTADPDLPPSMGQLIWLKQHRPHANAVCLFAERQPNSALMRKLQPMDYYPIDEVMAASTDFIQGWQALAQRLEQCVQ
ncbi:MAG: zinc ABC transporter substrate-binding protein [Candidatus Saccharibacteria bacterium]|nr:zinc ABC transporter substrate-binding protein [Moraxellaceae bacterium]